MVIQLKTSDFMDRWTLEANIKEYCIRVDQSDLMDDGAALRLLQNALPTARCIAVEPPQPLTFEMFLADGDKVLKQLDRFNEIGAHLNHRIIVPFETNLKPYESCILGILANELGEQLVKHRNIRIVLRNSIPHFNITRDYLEVVYFTPNIVKLFNSQSPVPIYCGLDIANAETTVRVISLLLDSGYGKTSKMISVMDFMQAMKEECYAVWVAHRIGADMRRQGYSLPSSVGAFTNTFQNIRNILGDRVKLILNVDEKAHEETIQTLERLSNEQII